jgi:hypothetical protein
MPAGAHALNAVRSAPLTAPSLPPLLCAAQRQRWEPMSFHMQLVAPGRWECRVDRQGQALCAAIGHGKKAAKEAAARVGGGGARGVCVCGGGGGECVFAVLPLQLDAAGGTLGGADGRGTKG